MRALTRIPQLSQTFLIFADIESVANCPVLESGILRISDSLTQCDSVACDKFSREDFRVRQRNAAQCSHIILRHALFI
jgi:hypothetical protein